MEQNEIAIFQQSIEACEDPAEIARKVKLTFKRMSGEMALACFAKVMTAELPHQIKVAVWDAVRYSHIWWGVDEVLKGAVMENPTVQQAFADAVPMRKWMVANKRTEWDNLCMTLGDADSYRPDLRDANKMISGNRVPLLIHLITHSFDFSVAIMIREKFPMSIAYVRLWATVMGTATIFSGISPIATTKTRKAVSLVLASNASCCGLK